MAWVLGRNEVGKENSSGIRLLEFCVVQKLVVSASVYYSHDSGSNPADDHLLESSICYNKCAMSWPHVSSRVCHEILYAIWKLKFIVPCVRYFDRVKYENWNTV
ncbi:hypothetical protein HELRODRAFT_171789 [Helobdella robusta]|uniref:Uncharacterized protein n=1 Tax=Helobdella robusta TaxID=6412 RepID=T1F4P0_HELRO|nr:hypothetical protein HELRODRAFT_171789 [Helobdella robusta]ESO05394.1 hypothetical protein HELRODRAFT_171789 [Helobdella robusta]